VRFGVPPQKVEFDDLIRSLKMETDISLQGQTMNMGMEVQMDLKIQQD
jgi:hypothetical protein